MEREPVTSVRAILFTDVVGSTELRSRLGEDRADELRRVHDDLLGTAIAQHHGTVLRWTGDGLKAEFASASAAISAAIAMQRAVAKYGRAAHAIAPFQIRVGLGVGEVTAEDGDIHGVAVIEAARLEALAAPGEILTTDLVQRLGHRRVDAGFDEVGLRTLKGLDHAVQVVRIVDVADDGATRPMPRVVASDRRFPLVGRSGDLAAAINRWEQVQAGQSTTVLVSGQPGMGKSRFIAHLAGLAHGDGALVLAGACDSDLAVPYQPLAMAFKDVQSLDDDLAAALESGTGPLGPLFPSGRSRADEHGPSARFDLFEAVVALIRRLADDQPVVLVLEDLHWATGPTVQLLRHVVRHSASSRVLILASYRAEEIEHRHPLNELLVDARSTDSVTRLDLGALREPDVVELVNASVPSAPADYVEAFAKRVCDESAGSPFFVCELLHHLVSTGQIEHLVTEGIAHGLPIPDSVRDVVGQRLGRLSTEAGDMLSVAAIIGQTFDLDVLADVVAQPPERVLELLEETEKVALVSEADAGRFAFAHAIVRSTLVDATSATRRRLMHRKVAQSIELLRPADHDELAHHWLLAGVGEKANAMLELAARRDLEALAYESAAERYQQLVDFHERERSADLTPVARAWLGLGLAQRAMGLPEYLPAVETAGRLARKLRDADLMADAAIASIWPGTFFMTAGQVESGLVELSEDALAQIDSSDPRRVRILSTLAAHLNFDPDRHRRMALLDEAHDIAEQNGDPELIGSVLVARYLTLWDPSTMEQRSDIARHVARMARASGDVALAFFAGFFEAVGAAERCDVAAARRHLGALDATVAATHNFYFRFLVDRFLVSLDVLAVRPGVQQDIDALLQRYDGTHADTVGTWSVQTGALAMQRGELGALVPTLQAMRDSSTLTPQWGAAFGLALVSSGDSAAALAVLNDLAEPFVDYFWLTTQQVVAELAVAVHQRERIAVLRQQLAPYRDQLGITASGSVIFGLVGTTLGELALAMGDHAAAIELLEEAVTRADSMDAPFEATKARRLLAAAMVGSGASIDRVQHIIGHATDLAQLHGFRGEADRLAQISLVSTSPNV